jgi:heterodisulfide reductase subunit C
MTAAGTALPATRIDVTLLDDIRQFGAADVSACFSCGVCTATCPLVTDEGTFPRRIIRFAQLGLRGDLAASRELWTCYACGQCSDACPQQAEPAAFMAAARRWAIASYDRTGLARALAVRPIVATTITILLAILLAAFMYSAHGQTGGATLDLFGFIPSEVIHNVGIAVMLVVVVAGLAGLASMLAALGRAAPLDLRRRWRPALRAGWTAVVVEGLGQRRYRGECEADVRPWFRRRWFIHATTMWGFLGLLAATAVDYGLELAGIKATGTPVPLWYPVRLLGTLAGVALLYGTTILIIRRRRGEEASLRSSTVADWLFLVTLWVSGATGFVLELALYLPSPPAWGYPVFLFHVAIAMELVLLVPFSKFAHAVYRPVALFFLAMATAPAHEAEEG